MNDSNVEVVVAGHICLDVIPTFEEGKGGLTGVLVPGKLVDVGPAVTATGGPVSNTGLSLHRLGVRTGLMGKVGDDSFGVAILELLRSQGEALAAGMIVATGEHSSYSVVISIPGVDRIFLHCPGANDTFGADDVAYEKLEGVRLFHFGYPPLMQRMFADGGAACEAVFKRVKEMGLTTSLDMARPDPNSPAGRVDWQAFLQRVLPHVDVFLPSMDEILYMIDRPRFDRLLAEHGESMLAHVDGELLGAVSDTLLALGTAVVVLKLGDQGLYVRTAAEAERLQAMGPCAPDASWQGRELYGPCFSAKLVGTTGSGDATIAGFLAALLQGAGAPAALQAGLAVGACSVEAPDATSGVPDWGTVEKRLQAGWESLPALLSLPDWQAEGGVLRGPWDGG